MGGMFFLERFLVYPDGDQQEIDFDPAFDDLVDLNGRPLAMPLTSARIIAYRVAKIRRVEEKGQDTVLYHLELVPSWELEGLVHR